MIGSITVYSVIKENCLSIDECVNIKDNIGDSKYFSLRSGVAKRSGSSAIPLDNLKVCLLRASQEI